MVKAGDKVCVKIDDPFGGYRKGDILHVIETDGVIVSFIDNDGDRRYLHHNDIEPVAVAPPPQQFKVGDRVQFNILRDDDDPGTVTGYSGGYYSVRWDSDNESDAACIWSESELRLVAPAPGGLTAPAVGEQAAPSETDTPTTIADIVRRLEALEAAALPAPEFNIGDKVTLTATVSGMNKRRVNIIIDGVPPAGCSLAVPPTALIAA